MRSLTHRALVVASLFAGLPKAHQIRALGKEVSDLTEAEAARVHRRITRGADGTALPIASIVHRSAQRRRARQTHPGKRGKHVSL